MVNFMVNLSTRMVSSDVVLSTSLFIYVPCKVIDTSQVYYKHLKVAAQLSHLGRKLGWFLADYLYSVDRQLRLESIHTLLLGRFY